MYCYSAHRPSKVHDLHLRQPPTQKWPHDAWSKLYASEHFVTWLLDDTFPAEAPVTCEQTVPGHASCADSAA